MDLNDIETVETEEQLGEIQLEQLPDALKEAVGRAGWTKLMPVQSKAIPYLLEERDIMVQSRTGSGKTGGFLLPSIERIDPNLAACQSLILTPTRELANQIAAEARMLFAETGVNIVPVYGGVPYQKQQSAFRRGAHVVVGTPGRVLDHLGRGNLKLEHIKMLTLDEADRMLSVGFYQDMKAVKRYLPDRRVNTCMFSATFPPYVLRLASDFLVDPTTLSLSSDTVHVTDIEHIRYDVVEEELDKQNTLVRIIETANPDNAIIFCNSRMRVKYVTTILERHGYDVDRLSGDLQQRARERVLKRIREGSLRLLVATDVAARGIDIPNLSHVIQYEVPEDIEAYVHRAGRTGRAGASGTAIILVAVMDKLRMGKVMRTYEVDMQTESIPEEAEVTAAINTRVEVALAQLWRERDEAFSSAALNYEPMVEQMMTDGSGIRALAMLVDDFYQTLLQDEKSEKNDVPPPLTLNMVQEIALALADDLTNRDTMRLGRIMRFEPMVEQLSMMADEFHWLTMLVADYHVKLIAEKAKSAKKTKSKSKRKSSSRPKSSGKRSGRKS